MHIVRTPGSGAGDRAGLARPLGARPDDGRAARRPPGAGRAGAARERGASWPRSSSTRCSSGRPKTSRAIRARSSDDAALLEAAGVDLLFAPSAERMYPAGLRHARRRRRDRDALRGRARPGHFAASRRSCVKLLYALEPTSLYFGPEGRAAGRRAAPHGRATSTLRDRASSSSPTVREPDGLALSSRNAYLSPPERARRAEPLSRAAGVADAVERGETDRDAARRDRPRAARSAAARSISTSSIRRRSNRCVELRAAGARSRRRARRRGAAARQRCRTTRSTVPIRS